MKTLMCILSVLILAATVCIGADKEQLGNSLALADKSSKCPFALGSIGGDPPGKNSATAKGDYFTTKFQQGWIAMWHDAKRTKDVLDLRQYDSVSVEVRIKQTTAVDVASVFVNFWQPGGKSVWEAQVPRSLIPADGKAHRVMIPLANLVPMGNPPPTDKTNIARFAFGVKSDTEHETLVTDLGNVMLWKTPVDEVKILPLDK